MRTTQNRPLKRRLEVVFIAFLISFFALALRLMWIQGIHHRQFAKEADKIHVRSGPVPAQRGVIRDIRGRELAANVEAADITANPRWVRKVANQEQVVQAVLQSVGGNPEFYHRRLSQSGYFAFLARGVDREIGQKLASQKIEGVDVRRGRKRVHPWGSLAAHILGYTDTEQRGIEGIELALESHLRGKDGHRVVEVDAAQRPIPDTEREEVHPVDGKEVVLTIDAMIQQSVEDALAQVVAAERPESAKAIVMDLPTGRILAMGNYPTYDPHSRAVVPIENRRNRAITDLYEPGSVFKLITAAAMLEENENTSVFCPGSMGVGRRVVRCAHKARHGRQELVGVIQHSCNVGAGSWGRQLGPERMYRYVKQFGFLEKTGIELRGEAVGRMAHPDKQRWAMIRTVNVAFGQGVVANALQVLRAYAAVANDGILPSPTIIHSIGGVRQQPRIAPRRILSSQNAARLREALTTVVTDGTGTATKIANYSVAGKTGTAQMARDGHYVRGAYVSSFVGFLPASRPRIGIIVAVTWPKVHQYGGTVAGPAFREIARHAVNYLDLQPDAMGDERDGRSPMSFVMYKRRGGPSPVQRVAGSFATYGSPNGPEMPKPDE